MYSSYGEGFRPNQEVVGYLLNSPATMVWVDISFLAGWYCTMLGEMNAGSPTSACIEVAERRWKMKAGIWNIIFLIWPEHCNYEFIVTMVTCERTEHTCAHTRAYTHMHSHMLMYTHSRKQLGRSSRVRGGIIGVMGGDYHNNTLYKYMML